MMTPEDKTNEWIAAARLLCELDNRAALLAKSNEELTKLRDQLAELRRAADAITANKDAS